MSMKRLHTLSGVTNSSNYGEQKIMTVTPSRGYPHTPGVNVMLGGAMLSGIILVVFILCYCCHKNGRKAETNSPYTISHRDPGLSLEVYTVEGQNCFIPEDIPIYEIHRIPATAPPPPYQEVVPFNKKESIYNTDNKSPVTDDSGLPTYEAAMKLEIAGNGYV